MLVWCRPVLYLLDALLLCFYITYVGYQGQQCYFYVLKVSLEAMVNDLNSQVDSSTSFHKVLRC